MVAKDSRDRKGVMGGEREEESSSQLWWLLLSGEVGLGFLGVVVFRGERRWFCCKSSMERVDSFSSKSRTRSVRAATSWDWSPLELE